jgi:hypothetical protein
MVWWELWTGIYMIERCCGKFGNNYTGVKGVVGISVRIIV